MAEDLTVKPNGAKAKATKLCKGAGQAKAKPRTKALARSPPSAPKPRGQLDVVRDEGKTPGRQFAELAVEGVAGDAHMVMTYTEPMFSCSDEDQKPSIGDYSKALRERIAEVVSGDLSGMEGMLVGQAAALSSIFRECARRSGMNMGEYPDAMERYMRLALKAQSQCRTTIEALAEIKNPRQVAFVRQANIAQNQQINNEAQPATRAEIIESAPNELEVIEHERAMDPRASGGGATGNKQAATVAAIDRAKDRRRQG